MDILLEMKITLNEVVKSIQAIEAVEKTLEGQRTIFVNRYQELQAEIRRYSASLKKEQ